MKTVKLTISNKIDVLDDMCVFSSIVRVAYNRYQDGMSNGSKHSLRWRTGKDFSLKLKNRD